MEVSTEGANSLKISKAIVDIVPKHLRSCFTNSWNEKHPDRQWQSDSASGEFLFNELPEKVKKEKGNEKFIKNLKNGNQREWDTSTLVFAMMYSGLQLVEPCRPKDERREPLRISEAIDIINKTRSVYFVHAESMSCPSDVYESVMEDLRLAARYLNDGAAKEIDEFVSDSQIGVEVIVQLMNQVKEEKNAHKDFEIFLRVREDYIKERTKVNRNKLRKDLELWNIRLINKNEDGKLFVWHERNREEYTAELCLLQTRTQNQAMPDEMRMFMNMAEEKEARVKYDELITTKERKCFLSGIAGIGKTSLVEYLALKWAKRELFLDKDGNDLFDFLFLIKCRELKESKNETIEEFFKRKFAVDPDNLKDHGERILIIVDGIDEDVKLEKSIRNYSKLRALLKRDHEFLKGHATIISGRPHIESVLSGVEDQIGKYNKIEVAGLSRSEIDKHIDVIANGNKAAAKRIKETIESSSNMSALAAIPQYLGTLCYVIAMQGEGASMNTDTMTTLYVWTLASFWVQHVQEKGQQKKGLNEKFSDKEVTRLYIKISEISYELLKEKKFNFKEGDFSVTKELSEENQEMFNTFFTKNETHRRPSYQFQHRTLQEFFAATYCMLYGIKIKELWDLELYEVVRFIGGFIVAKESPDDENIVKIFIECLENAQEEDEKSVQVVQQESSSKIGTFFNSVLDCLKEFKGRSEFAQHYALSLFHEMFEDASGGSNQCMANLDIDVITRFQDILDYPAFIYYGMSQIKLSYLVHFIESLFANGLQSKLNNMTLRIRFSNLENQEILKRLFKSFLFFKNVWFTRCDFVPYPWEMMNETGISPLQSQLAHLYIERCEMTEAEFMQLAHFIPFAKKVELIELELSDANCQEMIDAITKEQCEGKAKLSELKLIFCKVSDDLIKKFKNLKTIDAQFFQ